MTRQRLPNRPKSRVFTTSLGNLTDVSRIDVGLGFSSSSVANHVKAARIDRTGEPRVRRIRST